MEPVKILIIFASAYYSWILGGSSTSPKPITIHSGSANYAKSDRWGDHSFTSLDPNDDWSFWTVQQYAATQPQWGANWSTWIVELQRNP
jgi:hypothetical protein